MRKEPDSYVMPELFTDTRICCLEALSGWFIFVLQAEMVYWKVSN